MKRFYSTGVAKNSEVCVLSGLLFVVIVAMMRLVLAEV